MKLYQQLILFMLAASVLPLAIVGFLLLSRAEGALAGRIVSEHRVIAESTAQGVSGELMKTLDALSRAVDLFDWERVSPEEFQGGLRLLYAQSAAVGAVMAVDADGTPRGEPLFQTADTSEHPGSDAGVARTLPLAVRVDELRGQGKGAVTLGRIYTHASEGRVAVAVAVAVKLAEGERAPFLLAEVVLTGMDSLLAHYPSLGGEQEAGRIDLVETSRGFILASSQPERRLKTLPAALVARLADGGSGVGGGGSFRMDEPAVWVSAAPVPELPSNYQVVVSQDEAAALAPVTGMRRAVLVSILAAFAVLLGLGALFTRRINRRLAQVVDGAQAFSRGELSRRVQVVGEDELSELAASFNQMGGELEQAQGRLLRWNDDLKVRVDEATSDLRLAQVQLLEAQKLAAVGQLGAGVAHEINNPLAGILGNTQLMMLERDEKDPDFDTLRKIELSAKRCKEITQNLLRFSQQRAQPELRAVDLSGVLREALSLTHNQLQTDGIRLTTELASAPVRVRADPGHLSQVVLALVSNARTAMLKSERRELTLRTGERDGQGILEVEDTGKGIAPEHRTRVFEPFFTTKDVWSNVGLGLSVAWRVVSEAGGTIDLRTEVGQGTCFTVRLPKA